ncbi:MULTISPECIES: hypothetical protein [Flavobacterium]|uniref:Uncharacterized protein n=1 Tax=Flavobacterium jumunjinense TaxID=998845 RepID=A0ABV5GI53_9FLAO|nr:MULTISPECIES: hypothetical protein [Flavobacterium]
MKKNSLKYLILTLIGLLWLKIFFPFGDYCSGLLDGLMMLFFGGIFTLLFIILFFVNIFHVNKQNRKFDYILVLIFLFFSFFFFIMINLKQDKFWTRIIWEGDMDVNKNYDIGNLKLYKNNTFEAIYEEGCYKCVAVGDFKMKHDTLYLLRKDIVQKTDSVFTDKYLFNKNKTRLLSIQNSFISLKKVEY